MSKAPLQPGPQVEKGREPASALESGRSGSRDGRFDADPPGRGAAAGPLPPPPPASRPRFTIQPSVDGEGDAPAGRVFHAEQKTRHEGPVIPVVSAAPDGQVQAARGLPRYGLAAHRFPQMPAPQPAQWTPGTSGPYHVSTQMDAILTPNWNHLQGGPPVTTKFTADVEARNQQVPGLYHRGHILARSLKGPGAAYNMVPLTETANIAMRDNVENPIREHLTQEPVRGVLSYTVNVAYGQGAALNRSIPERYLPAQLTFQLTEYQSPEDPQQFGDLQAWLQNDPEPASPVNLAPINVVLPNFNQPFPAGAAAQPVYGAYAQADQEVQTFQQDVAALIANLAQNHLSTLPLTARQAQVNDQLQGLGVGYGITQEDGQLPAIAAGQLHQYLVNERQAFQSLHDYLLRAQQVTNFILGYYDNVDVADEREILEDWENDITQVWMLADNLDLHRAPWAEALNDVATLISFLDGSYVGPEDLEGLNFTLQQRLQQIRGLL